jgi:hypothetical protein
MQQYFQRENNRGYELESSALFLLLFTTLTGDVASGMK